VRGVDYRGVRAEEAGLREQFDGSYAVLGETLCDLTLLLVGVDVQGEIPETSVISKLFQPVSRNRPDAVGRNAHPDQRAALCPPPKIVDPV
jgi:hypothetical protein